MAIGIASLFAACNLISAHADDLTASVLALSSYDEGPVDLAKVKSDGIVLLLHRATVGISKTDKEYSLRNAAAGTEGLLWGAYHFGRHEIDPRLQAEYFVRTLIEQNSKSNSSGRVLMVLDVERYAKKPGQEKAGAPISMTTEQAAAFMRRVHELTGRYPGLFMGQSSLDEQFKTEQPLDQMSADLKVLRNCWLWISNLGDLPDVQAGRSPWNAWTFWNYCGDIPAPGRLQHNTFAKQLPSLPLKNVALSYFAGTRDTLKAFYDRESWDYALK